MRSLACAMLAALTCLIECSGAAWSAEAAETTAVPFQRPAGATLRVEDSLRPFRANLASDSGIMFAAASGQGWGGIYSIGPDRVTLTYRRPGNGAITSFDIGPWPDASVHHDALYYCDAAGNLSCHYVLGAPGPGVERVTETASFGIGRVALRKADQLLYASEPHGVAAGKIWKINPDGHGEVFCTVLPNKVGGRWDGQFAFSPGGVLYVAGGTGQSTGIYRCTLIADPTLVHTEPGPPIRGFHFAATDTIVVANGTPTIWKSVFGGERTVAFSSSAGLRFSDVLVR